jgi:hypothetical protein
MTPADEPDELAIDIDDDGVPEEVMQAAWAEAIRECYADGTFRHAPCRDCGEVTFFPDRTEEFCVNCRVEHTMMRAIALAPDRYCAHCRLIRGPSPGFNGWATWRDHPTCLACGEAGYFPELGEGVTTPLCRHCEAKRTFEDDPFCQVCGAIDLEVLQLLISYIRQDWEADEASGMGSDC